MRRISLSLYRRRGEDLENILCVRVVVVVGSILEKPSRRVDCVKDGWRQNS